MKKVLVTGSESYIGSVLTDYLEKNGFDVTGMDTGLITDCLLYPASFKKTIFKDTRDIKIADLEGFDAVVYLAGISNDPFRNFDPKKIYDPVRNHTVRTAKLCKKLGIKFIFASSCSIYGKGVDNLMNEDSTVYPQTPYSVNKLQIEEDLKKISDKSFAPTIFRFATVFGLSPRMRFDLVLNMFTAMAFATKKITLNSDGKAWRPLVHVLDVCKAIKLALNHKNISGKPLILNVGSSSSNYQIIELAKIVQAQVQGCKIEFLNNSSVKNELIKDRKIQDGVDSRNYKISFDKITKVFPEFECDFTVLKGVQEMLKKFEEISLKRRDFEDLKFYRLQTFEKLIKDGFITEELRWIRKLPEKPLDLYTQRLHLRLFTTGDITPGYIRSLNSETIIGLTESRYRKWTKAEVKNYIETKGNIKNESMLIGIFLKGKKEKHIGNIRLHSFSDFNKRVEVGILIWDKLHWGKGYATEALDTISNYIFYTLNFHKICAEYYSINKASAKIFKKLKFNIEGIFKEHFFVNGEFIDAIRVAKYNPVNLQR